MRTEEEKLIQAPIIVTFGGKPYEVKPLVIKESRAWRQAVVKVLAALPRYAAVTTDKAPDFEAALNAMLVDMPDTVVNLFFQYAKGLNREEVEAIATDAEMAKGFEQVVEVAFPLARSLVRTMTSLAR